jgi:hypothetical protein
MLDAEAVLWLLGAACAVPMLRYGVRALRGDRSAELRWLRWQALTGITAAAVLLLEGYWLLGAGCGAAAVFTALQWRKKRRQLAAVAAITGGGQ